MCETLEKYNRETREKALQEGNATGQMQKDGMSLEKIVKFVKYPKEKVEKWLENK